MSGIDVSSLLKRFARLSELKLGGLYAVVILPVTVLNELGPAPSGWAWLTPLATAAALGAFSVLVSVIALYRDDDYVLAGILMAGITGAAMVIAWLITMMTLSHSLTDVVVLAVAGVLGLLWRLILMGAAFAALVWLLRKLRPWLAPDTATDAAQ